MKTILTTLPIYKALRDQCYERGMANGAIDFRPIFCPRHRLPSFQWMDDGDGATTVSSVYLVNATTNTDISTYFQALPTLYTADSGDDYFIYNGTTLNQALPIGSYYLKITMDTNHVYYSDWFTVQCVYCNFATTFVNTSYNTFTVSGMTITAVSAGAAYANSNEYQTVYLGQQISVMFYLTTSGTTAPQFAVYSASLGLISDEVAASAGLNELTLTTTRAADDAYIRILNSGASNFSTTEILIYTQYACGYVTLSFSNCCNLGSLLYENDFYQTLWMESDNIEQSYPYVEKGQENGDGKFIPTWRRQEKTYTIRLGLVSQYMVDVLHRLKMHDVMTFIDQVGDAFNVESVDVEHEWNENKYYAIASVTLDLGESVTALGCC